MADDQIDVSSSKAKTKVTNNNNDKNDDITMNNNIDDDFSEQDISNILSKAKVTDATLDDLELLNLDDDLAKLEANLGKLGNFDFEMDDDSLQDIFGDISPTEMEAESEGDLDSALRDIESGKFDINTFMKDDDVISDKVPDVDVSISSDIDKSKARKKKSKGKDGDDDGVIEPPPLEEFKRLMESLGPDSMFDEESAYKSKALEEINTNVERHQHMKVPTHQHMKVPTYDF